MTRTTNNPGDFVAEQQTTCVDQLLKAMDAAIALVG
jgi:hypothetical protein